MGSHWPPRVSVDSQIQEHWTPCAGKTVDLSFPCEIGVSELWLECRAVEEEQWRSRWRYVWLPSKYIFFPNVLLGEKRRWDMMTCKECRASTRVGFVPPFLQQNLKGTGREREGCCGQQHAGGRMGSSVWSPVRCIPWVEYHRHGLLALKHLVSLRARVRPSVQAELDLHTTDRWEERDRKKKKCYICSLKRVPYKRRLAIVFFFRFYRSGVCMYSL